MFGHKADPTKNFRYGGCRRKFPGDTLVDEQMRKGHRLRNAFVALELDRRKRLDDLLRQYSPELVEVEAKLAELESKVEAAVEALQAYKRAKRTRTVAKELVDAVKAAKAERKPFYDRRKALRAELFAKSVPDAVKASLTEFRHLLTDEQKELAKQKKPLFTFEQLVSRLQLRVASLDRAASLPPIWYALESSQIWHEARRRELYNQASEDGLYWGTALAVMQATMDFAKGPPPKFKRWRGDGRVAVQLQGGASWEEIVAGDSKLLRIVADNRNDWSHHSHMPDPNSKRSKRLRRCIAYVRVSSNTDRTPIWAGVPVVIHRDPPPGSQVKWAYLHRRMVGGQPQWTLTLSISNVAGFPVADRAPGGACGVDLGWRIMPDGRLRVGYWYGNDDDRGEISLPPKLIEEMRTVDRIAGHRTVIFNQVLGELAAFLKDKELPEAMRPELEGMADATNPSQTESQLPAVRRWRSKDRLVHFVRQLFEADPDWLKLPASNALADWAALEAYPLESKGVETGLSEGPPSMRDVLQFWVRRERHLFPYEANLRQQLIAYRLDFFRCVAAKLRRKYQSVYLEGETKDGKLTGKAMDLTKFGRKALPEGTELTQTAQRWAARLASPGQLRDCLTQSMLPVFVDPAYSTQDCSECGFRNEDIAAVKYTCGGCGRTRDQDESAAKNLLAGNQVAV